MRLALALVALAAAAATAAPLPAPAPAPAPDPAGAGTAFTRLLRAGARAELVERLRNYDKLLANVAEEISHHQELIARELGRPRPDLDAVEGWADTLDRHRREFALIGDEAAALRRQRDALGAGR